MTPKSEQPTASTARLNTAQAATYLGVAKDTLVTWRCTGQVVVPYLKLGSKVFYRKSDLDNFLDSCLVNR